MQGQCSAVRHRVDRICRKGDYRLLYMSAVRVNGRNVFCNIELYLDPVAADLMRNEPCRRIDDLGNVERMPVACSYSAEIKQAGRDRFAAKGFALYQTEIFVKIFDRLAAVEHTVLDPMFERFGEAEIVASGLFISCTTPAANLPTAASFSARPTA